MRTQKYYKIAFVSALLGIVHTGSLLADSNHKSEALTTATTSMIVADNNSDMASVGHYVGKEIIFAKWGSGDGEVGLSMLDLGPTHSGQPVEPQKIKEVTPELLNSHAIIRNGPSNFVINGVGYVYIGDRQNNRILVFDNIGKFIKNTKLDIKDSFYDFTVDKDGDVYLLQSVADNKNMAIGENLVKYSEKKSASTITRLSSDVFKYRGIKKLRLKNGNIYIKGRDIYKVGEKYTYLDTQSQKKIDRKSMVGGKLLSNNSLVAFSENSYWDYASYDYNLNKEKMEINLTNSSGETNKFSLPLYHRDLGPNFTLQSDASGNVYAIYGIHLNPAYYKSSIKEYNVPPVIEIYKYKKDGVLLSKIELDANAWTYANIEDNVVILPDGTIYYYLPKEEGVYVYQYSLQK